MIDKELGQFFLVGFSGWEVDRHHFIVEAIERQGVGGVILFDRNVDGSIQNITDPEQLRRLTVTLQSFSEIPLLIAVDQEGGRVCRLKEGAGFPATRSARELGERDEAEFTRKMAAQMAETLADVGVNLNLTPVVDLDLNVDNPIIARYQRSFGADPRRVVRHARLVIDEHRKQGIGCCLKHFPGHGSAGSDSHLGFVDITKSWAEEELAPYEELFATDYDGAVMTAHVVNRRLDPSGLPATLSPAMVQGVLRQRLGFQGVVFSDDLQMRAISDHFGYEEAVQRAILAGIDIVVIGNNLVRSTEVVSRGVAALQQLLADGRVDEQYLRAALARIYDFKKKLSPHRK